MAFTPPIAIDVPGVLVGVAELTVVPAPAVNKERTVAVIRLSNATGPVGPVSVVVNVFKYSGAGPGGDSNRISPKNYVLAPSATLEIGPFYLAVGQKITAICDTALGLTVVAEVLERDSA